MTKAYATNEAGVTFSNWAPAEKFQFILAKDQPTLAMFVSQELSFDEDRRYRFDFCWPSISLAVEIDGFGYGHQAQQCMAEDNEKSNRAVELGWRVLRYNSRQLGSVQGVRDAVEQVWSIACLAGLTDES